MEQKKCSKCRKVHSLTYFIGKNQKETKVCQDCRNKRGIAYSKKPEREVQITSGFKSSGRSIELLERVDKDKLNYIISNYDRSMGSWYNFQGAKALDMEGQKTLLIGYHNSLNANGEVYVKYKQKSYGFGRYYGSLKLQVQNLTRKIRHTICEETMVDLDIVNAHPELLLWYCKTNKVPCDGLSYYIDNRDACIAEIMQIKNLSRDEVKTDLLAIINGRVKNQRQFEGYPKWYVDYYNNLVTIKGCVNVLEPQYRKTAIRIKQGNGKGDYNIDGTTINYLMTELENQALMCMYDVCLEENIEVASLCYDGMMVYKRDLPNDLNKLLRKMEARINTILPGCELKIKDKPMVEGWDINHEIMEYLPKRLDAPNKEVDVLFRKYGTDYVSMIDVDESVKYVQDLEFDGRVLCINSAMGSGKTSAICRYIKEHNPKRVIVLSPRISYAKSITNEYNEKIKGEDQLEFICYKHMKKEHIETCDRIVISMESLHKLDFDYCKANPFDLIVVDECQANLTSHTCRETNGKHFDNNSNTFYSLLRHGKNILFCDAFINAKTIEFLTYFQLPTLLLNYKTPMEQRDAVVVQTEKKDYDALLPYIAEELKLDRKIYLCMSSATRAAEWELVLKKKFPNKKIKLYSRGEGKEIEDVRKTWSELDLVMTTTTITVGINFDLSHFDKCYMSFSSRAKNSVVDLFQCHYRVRHLKKQQLVVHIVDEPEMVSCSEDKIMEDLKWFETHKIELYNQFELAPDYLKKLLCYNQIERNLSVAKLTNCVFAFLQECNYSVTYDKKKDDLLIENDLAPDEEGTITDFKSIELLDKREYIKLRGERSGGVELSNGQKDQLKKYEFIDFFTGGFSEDWVDDKYDEDFWKIYNSYRTMKLNNIKTEKKLKKGVVTFNVLFSDEWAKNKRALMSGKSNARVREMVGILKDLGLDHSQKVGSEISRERLNMMCTKVRNNGANMRRVFGLRDRRKNAGDVMDDKQCIEMLNSIFKDYGYTQLTQKSVLKYVDCKRVRDVDAPYVIQDFKSCLKSQDLSPELGMRIYNSFIVENKIELSFNQRRAAFAVLFFSAVRNRSSRPLTGLVPRPTQRSIFEE